MSRPNLSEYSISHKDWLKLQLQESSDNSLDEKMIENWHPVNHLKFRHYINNMLGISHFIFGLRSSASQSFLTWTQPIDDNELLYENNFQSDKLLA